MFASAEARARAGGYLTLAVGAVVGLMMTSAVADAEENGLPYGRAATPQEITAWDIDIRPDGLGLPAGSASAADGGAIGSSAPVASLS